MPKQKSHIAGMHILSPLMDQEPDSGFFPGSGSQLKILKKVQNYFLAIH
jgi:hypothetical protein